MKFLHIFVLTMIFGTLESKACSSSERDHLQKLNKTKLSSYIEQYLEKNGGQFDPKELAKKLGYKAKHEHGFLNLENGIYETNHDSVNQAETYSKYVVYNSNTTTIPFSITLIVLAPGQGTPIHDHKVECAPVVLKGQMKHIKYRQLPSCEEVHKENLKHLGDETYGFKPCLEQDEEYIMNIGDSDYLIPYQDINSDTHRIANNADETSISMHLYLFDANKKVVDGEGNFVSDSSVKNHFELYEVN